MRNKIRGVRVEEDKVIISVKGGNDAAKELCEQLLLMEETMNLSEWIGRYADQIQNLCPGVHDMVCIGLALSGLGRLSDSKIATIMAPEQHAMADFKELTNEEVH